MKRSILILLSISFLSPVANFTILPSDVFAQRESPATPQIVGIHTIILRSGVKREDFEKFMTKEAFSTAAEVPGGVSRGGQSAIKSQHLLKGEGDSREYLWIVKASGVFGPDLFSSVFKNMYETAREKLEAFGTLKSSTTFVVVDSLDVGRRDQLGRPVGKPKRGSRI